MSRLKSRMGMIGIGAVILLALLASSKQVRSQRGMAGIGSLIIFIAVIIVAAVAASVMISSGGSLQQKALITGNEAKEGITPALDVMSIRGSDASQSGTPHAITRLSILARLPAGASELSFNKTIITLDSNAGMQTYMYTTTVADSQLAAGTSDYVVTYLKEGPYQQDGYVGLGDTVNIKLNLASNMGENTRARMTVIPRAGNINQIEFLTPDTMVEPSLVLWPMT